MDEHRLTHDGALSLPSHGHHVRTVHTQSLVAPGRERSERAPVICDALLLPDGSFRRGQFHWEDGRWHRFELTGQTLAPRRSDYLVAAVPVEWHCHGLAGIDFSAVRPEDLEIIDRVLEREGTQAILTMYLRRRDLTAFVRLQDAYLAARSAGRLTSILGLALEGPFFASFGGTPRSTVWSPTREEWNVLLSRGEAGLSYMVFSPDALEFESDIARASVGQNVSLEWVVSAMVEAGVRPAIGHFQRHHPERSARLVELVLDQAARRNRDVRVVTDHLYNDMPRRFRHTWRRPEERLLRACELEEQRLEEWRLEKLAEQVGPVPAAIMQAAVANRLTACLNFDGEHVDLAVARRTVELLGSHALIAMTDRADADMLGGQRLSMYPGGTLVYQSEGIVAAGSQPIDRQMRNMRGIGLTESEIWAMVSFNALRVLGQPPCEGVHAPNRVSYIAPDQQRYLLAC